MDQIATIINVEIGTRPSSYDLANNSNEYSWDNMDAAN